MQIEKQCANMSKRNTKKKNITNRFLWLFEPDNTEIVISF